MIYPKIVFAFSSARVHCFLILQISEISTSKFFSSVVMANNVPPISEDSFFLGALFCI